LAAAAGRGAATAITADSPYRSVTANLIFLDGPTIATSSEKKDPSCRGENDSLSNGGVCRALQAGSCPGRVYSSIISHGPARVARETRRMTASLRQYALQGATICAALPRGGWLGQLLQDQSSLLSYIDVFWLFTVAVALMMPLALLLLRPIEQPSGGTAHVSG